jgi:uncharacterized protein
MGLLGVSRPAISGYAIDLSIRRIVHRRGHHRRAGRTLNRAHINTKYDCHTCQRDLYVRAAVITRAYVRYGDTSYANLHYCDWIRGWTDVCLRIYGEIAARNPKYLERFDERKAI